MFCDKGEVEHPLMVELIVGLQYLKACIHLDFQAHTYKYLILKYKQLVKQSMSFIVII